MSSVPWVWPPVVIPPAPPPVTTASVRAALYATGSRPLWVPPDVADPDDDEFDSTDSAALLAKYIFRDRTTGPTNRTPNFGSLNENVPLSGATTPPSVLLHTQGRASWMIVQTTPTGPAAYAIMKPFTWRAGRVYWTRISAMVRESNGTPSSTTYPAFCMAANSGGLPDFNNFAYVNYDVQNTTFRYLTVVGGGASNNTTIPVGEGWGIQPYFLFANPANVLGAPATWAPEAFTDDGTRVCFQQSGGQSFSFTPAWIGWLYNQSARTPGLMAVDFLRASPNHPLFHPY
jgi:hypothetical protein